MASPMSPFQPSISKSTLPGRATNLLSTWHPNLPTVTSRMPEKSSKTGLIHALRGSTGSVNKCNLLLKFKKKNFGARESNLIQSNVCFTEQSPCCGATGLCLTVTSSKSTAPKYGQSAGTCKVRARVDKAKVKSD